MHLILVLKKIRTRDLKNGVGIHKDKMKTLLIFVTLVGLCAGCTFRKTLQPLTTKTVSTGIIKLSITPYTPEPTKTLAVKTLPVTSLTPTSTIDYLATLGAQIPQPTPENIVASGTVSDGPFTFTLIVYSDPLMGPEAPLGPSSYSDLPGIGVYVNWVYNGSKIQGAISENCGTAPYINTCGSFYNELNRGDQGGRAGGGILLPGGWLSGTSEVGDQVRWLYAVYTPEGVYGVQLVFTLIQGTNGFQPSEISILSMDN